MPITSWLDGWKRVRRAPAIVAGVFALTFVLALPLALTLRAALTSHLGRSLVAGDVADGVSYDWWQEFSAQAAGLGAGLGTTFLPAIIGFAATLDNIGSVADGQAEVGLIASALAAYVAGWTFIAGGVLDRYARQRPTRASGFFAAAGVYFFRFLRLAAIAGVFYWWMFTYLHAWLFDEWYPALTRSISVERQAFAVRAGMYALFGAVLLLGNMVFDYAKIRAVVEDRRSMIGALSAALRFIVHHPGRTLALYALNTAGFLLLLALWALAAPGAGGGASIWVAFAIGQLYLLARLLLKLHFLASQTALFQANLAHAAYTAAPTPVWPEAPAAETVTRL